MKSVGNCVGELEAKGKWSRVELYVQYNQCDCSGCILTAISSMGDWLAFRTPLFCSKPRANVALDIRVSYKFSLPNDSFYHFQKTIAWPELTDHIQTEV